MLQIPRENRMNMHKNARLTPRGRERIVRQVASGQTPEAVAEAAGICPRTDIASLLPLALPPPGCCIVRARVAII